MKTLIIPFYQSEKIVKKTVDFLLNHYSGDSDIEFIFVNDGSLDNTEKLLLEYIDPRISVISYAENKGKGYAIKQGILKAKGDRIVFTDDDIPYGIHKVDLFFRDLQFVKAVIGKRVFSSGVLRNFIHYMCRVIVFFSCGFEQTDTQCGIKGMRSSIAKKFVEKSVVDKFGFDIEILYFLHINKIAVLERYVKQINNTESTIKFNDLLIVAKDFIKMKRNKRKYFTN